MTTGLSLSDADRLLWQGQVASARRMLKRGYPTMAIEPELILVIGAYLAVVESRLDFRRDKAYSTVEHKATKPEHRLPLGYPGDD